MIAKILDLKTKTITSAAFILGVSTFISGLLGVLKMRLLVSQYWNGEIEAGIQLDSFFAAFRVPDLLSATLITGGIIVAFLPLFSQYFRKDEEEAWVFANNVLNVVFVSLSFLCLVLWFLAPLIISLIAPGFGLEQKQLTVSLARIMFVGPLLFGVSGIFSGILQHFDRFMSYALAPILYNIGIIFGILVLSIPFPESEKIYGAAWGVVLGAFLHFLVQVPTAIKSGFKYRFLFNPFSESVKKISKLMIPRTIGQASSQINLIVITAIASTLSIGSVAIFNFAHNLYLFPVAIIGVSFAVAAFPAFSRSWAKGEKSEFFNSFSSSFRQVVFVILPLSFLMFVLRAQVVRIVLGAKGFGWEETKITAACLGLFSIGVFFASLTPLLVRLFFSFQDTKTPALTAVFSVVFNISLSFALVYLFSFSNLFSDAMAGWLKIKTVSDIRVIGLALAVSLSALFNFSLLLIFLKRKIKSLPLKEIKNSTINVLIASLLASQVCYMGLRLATLFVKLETFWAVFFQLSVATIVGILAYLLTLFFLDPKEINLLGRSIKLIKLR
jgi:putative peptidoglycan lipid II flippase